MRAFHSPTTACAFLLVCATSLLDPPIRAASPEAITAGKVLFEKNWSPRNPALVGSDGLGPLFNGQSCVTCHRQGGVGGGGEAEFNAKSIGIESMQVKGSPMNRDVVHQAIRQFHPGFVDPSAGIVNALPLAHHGGTSDFDEARKNILAKIPSVFSENGGPVNAAEVRRANGTPILFTASAGSYETSIKAWIFQRNTPALFGAGLIDQVSSRDLRKLERVQKKHPEISGRIATLPDGRMGRFGWRGNVPTLLDFCDQACAAEVGLKTRRINQPADPMAPAYFNPTYDISDAQIRAMASFVAALPAPVRTTPEDSEKRRMALRGEQLFNSIGCAVCHTPTVGPAVGLYSDLLLHDMGPQLYDLNPADPYISSLTPVHRMARGQDYHEVTSTTMVNDSVMGTFYYGSRFSMEPGETRTSVSESTRGRGRAATRARLPVPEVRQDIIMTSREYRFLARPTPPVNMRIVNPKIESRQWSETERSSERVEREIGAGWETASGNDTYLVDVEVTSTTTKYRTDVEYTRARIEPTNFTQEWRTPPLWGVRDSAPYMHDGRAETLLEATTMHEGEAEGTRDRFLKLSLEDRQAIIEFMETLVAPPNAPKSAI